jgi:hypothetical protein
MKGDTNHITTPITLIRTITVVITTLTSILISVVVLQSEDSEAVVLGAEDSEAAAMAVAVMAEATGKLKEKASEEGPMWAFSFCSIFVSSNPDFHKLL